MVLVEGGGGGGDGSGGGGGGEDGGGGRWWGGGWWWGGLADIPHRQTGKFILTNWAILTSQCTLREKKLSDLSANTDTFEEELYSHDPKFDPCNLLLRHQHQYHKNITHQQQTSWIRAINTILNLHNFFKNRPDILLDNPQSGTNECRPCHHKISMLPIFTRISRDEPP